jgi:hypothetical protein
MSDEPHGDDPAESDELAVFAYKAVNARGEKVGGEVRALHRDDALAQIKALGVFPTKLEHVSGPLREPPSQAGAHAIALPVIVAILALTLTVLLATLSPSPQPAPLPPQNHQSNPAPIDTTQLEVEDGR